MDGQNDPKKLKFLPRNFQRSQPAGSSKSKRRVTVEDENAGDEESDRRSVFERLGPGGSQRSDKQKHHEVEHSGSHSKGDRKRDLDKSPDNLRLTFKGRQSGSKDPESKLKSQVVVRKSGGGGSDEDSEEESDSWSIDKLDQRRKEIQQALSALEANEDGNGEGKKSESSGSDSSPERPLKKKKEKSSKKKEKKKHKKASAEKEQLQEKLKDGKRKHDSDDEVANKKRKKKKQDKKHDQEIPVNSQATSELSGKHKRGAALHRPIKGSDLYNPESPTSITRAGSGDDEKRSSSFSPRPKMNKGKKKKKKMKAEAEPMGKSKKLMSPLKKVLKVKKGAGSVTSSRRSLSGSRGRRQSRLESSSSSGSSSPSLSRKKKPASTAVRETTRKGLKFHDKRRKRDRKAASSSSSSTSSSSSSPPPSADRRRDRKGQDHMVGPEKMAGRTRKARSPQHTSGKEQQPQKRKRRNSADSWSHSRDRGAEDKRGGAGSIGRKPSLERGREKERGRKEELGRGVSGRRNNDGSQGRMALHENRADRGESGRRDNGKGDAGGGGRDGGRGMDKERGRNDSKGKRGSEVKKDEPSRDRGDNNRGGHDNRRAGSLNRDDRGRRGPVFNAPLQGLPHTGRGSRFGQRDNDRRAFEEPPGGRFPGNDGQRMGEFDIDRERQRPGFDRGPGRGQGRGRSWDERGRREGDCNFRDDWDGGRGRGGGFAKLRSGDDRSREFGGTGREDRRGGGREERLLPHLAGGGVDGNKSSGPGDETSSRFPTGGDGGRTHQQRDSFREEQQQQEGSQDSRDREAGRARRAGEENDGRMSRGSGRPDLGSVPGSKDRAPDKDKGSKAADKSGVSGSNSKQSSVMKVKAEALKGDSPQTREETSLASLFSQTESVTAKKKPPAKTFGGKKSSKSADESGKPSDKPKPNLSSRGMSGRGRRAADRRAATSRSTVSAKGKENEKDEGKTVSKKEESTKDKPPRTPSPKGSQKSADSPSRQSQSRSSRRLSRSPESRRAAGAPGTTRSPAPPKRGDGDASSSRKQSHSPAPSVSVTRERDVREAGGKSSPAPSAGSCRGRRKKEEEKPKTEPEKGKKRGRSDSVNRSGSESRNNSQVAVSAPEGKKRRKSSDSESLPAKLDGGDIAAAMLGDAMDDGQQEEKVFSDWSDDDDADSILMGGVSRKHLVEDFDYHRYDEPRADRGARAPGRHHYADLRDRLDYEKHGLADVLITEKPALEKNIPNVKIVEDIQKEKPARERRRRNTDGEGYEEISSDENDLDEEGERVTKRSIVSILDIDLAALMPSSSKASKLSTLASGPVFERYKPASIFSQLGISKDFAGEQLYKEVTQVCQRQLEDMQGGRTDETNEAVKNEAASTSKKSGVKDETAATTTTAISKCTKDSESLSKQEPTKDTDKLPPPCLGYTSPQKSSTVGKPSTLIPVSKPGFKLYSGVPAFHKFLKAKSQQRSLLLNNGGIFRRALTARKDLDIRRQLCKIDPKYDQGAVYPSGAGDTELFQQCMQIFRQKQPVGLSPAQFTTQIA